jgi:hypothetical protein
MCVGKCIEVRGKCWKGSAGWRRWTQNAKYPWRPDLCPKLKDWVADFARAGQATLGGTQSASRIVMFRLYHLGLVPYEQARHFLVLSERGCVNWSEEVRRECRAEMLRRGMFPPRNYFSGKIEREDDSRQSLANS